MFGIKGQLEITLALAKLEPLISIGIMQFIVVIFKNLFAFSNRYYLGKVKQDYEPLIRWMGSNLLDSKWEP